MNASPPPRHQEYIDQSPEAQANKYAFKCHRRPLDGKDMAFPVRPWGLLPEKCP